MAKNYEIREIELTESQEQAVLAMQERGHGRSFDEKAISLNTFNPYCEEKTLFLGAYQNEKIIAFNAFTPHEFKIGEESIIGYQSGWAISDPDVQVWGAYFDLIINARKILKQRGGRFIFGYPNENSEPIFTKTLKFSSCNLYTGKIIANSLILNSKIKQKELPNQVYINSTIDQFKFKQACRPNKTIHHFENGDDYIWGVVNTKKKSGLSIKYFSLGGFNLSNGHSLLTLLKNASKALPIQYIEVVAHPNSVLPSLIPSLKESTKTEPFILYDLQKSGITATDYFNLSAGIKDAY